jgi:integrase
MRKSQVDLKNAVVHIPDSKTPNGVADVPLTTLALEAFRDQMAIAGEGECLFPSDLNQTGHQTTFKTVWRQSDSSPGKNPLLSDLRPSLNIRNPVERGGRCRRMGDPIAATRRLPGLQEVLANEAADEAGGFGEAQSVSK